MRFAVAVSCLALATAAFAEPATPEGAKKIADGYAAFLSAAAIEKGFVSVKPDGEDYVVTYDIQKALAALDAPAKAVEVSPFSYRLTPTANGGWKAKADALPKITITQGAAEGGTIAFDGFRYEGTYDPAAADFYADKLAMPTMRYDLKIKAGEKTQRMQGAMEGLGATVRVRAGAGADTIDLRTTGAGTASSQKTTVLGEGGAEALDSEMKQGASTGDSGFTGLRGKAFGEFWRYLVAHAGKPGPKPEEMKPLLGALLPLWRELAGRAEINDIAVGFPGGSVTMKSAFEDLKMTGLAEHASFSLGLAFRDVSAEVAGAPDWVKGIWPASLGLKIEGGVDGLDRAARMALDDPDFVKTGTPSKNTSTALAALMVAGRPHLKLSATEFKTPLGVATLEGEAEFVGEPSAKGRVTADSLDKLMQTLAKLSETEPEAQNYLYLATFVKGLARNEDGKMIWDIEYVAPDGVKVNGQQFPPAEGEKSDDDEDGDEKQGK